MNCRCAAFQKVLDSEHASRATSVKVKVPAMLIDAISFEESASHVDSYLVEEHAEGAGARAPWLCWTELRSSWSNSSNLTVRSVSQGTVLPPPKGGERAASMLRCPARND